MAQFGIKGASRKRIKLPKWLPVKSLAKIFDIIQKQSGNAMLVGGCVRDIILNRESYDIDIASTLMPEKLMEVFQKEVGFKVIPTGIKHGTVTLLYDGMNFELTTLRRDIECFGRAAKVEYTTDWLYDSSRRDFTINAIYLNLDGILYDFHDGFSDLKYKIVRFIGQPQKRIEEDHLRILRYFRFLSYYGVQNLDKQSFDATKVNVQRLQDISGERIQMEFKKIFQGEFADESIKLMNEQGVIHSIFDTKLKEDFVFHIQKRFNEQGNQFAVCLAALLYNLEGEVLQLASYSKGRFKLSNSDYKLMCRLLSSALKYSDAEKFHKRLCYIHGKEYYKNFLQLLDIIDILYSKEYINWEAPKFPINSKDLSTLGFEGKALGDALKFLEEEWINSNFKASKEQLTKKLIEIF